ncbi:MAG: PAS domain-containing sensor histidine kinase [Hymenobacter sp.]|nr:MAG: PAS domain-containing sensor histidine kinase [Hymenobacter sp.]
MPDLAAFFFRQAEASIHVQFVYSVAESRFVFVNAAYAAVLHGTVGQENAELPALLARLHPDDRAFLARYWQLWQRGQMRDETEVRLQQPGQPDQWLCLTPTYQQAADGTVLLGGELRDISATKHYQQNADTFNTRKNAVLEIVSHDLSGAFIQVQQLTQHLQAELPAQPPNHVAELLAVLEATSQDSVRMIRDFINLEFLSSTNTDLKRSRVDLGATLRVSLAQLQQEHVLLGQPFTYTLPTDPVYVQLDTNKFTQVLTNLVSNALKFTPDGKPVAVHVEAAGPGTVQVRVQDEGIGIPAALLPHVFERFTPARRPGLRGEPTTGLGLALCKTIVEWHQGTISVASTEGQGSTFTIELPQA